LNFLTLVILFGMTLGHIATTYLPTTLSL